MKGKLVSRRLDMVEGKVYEVVPHYVVVDEEGDRQELTPNEIEIIPDEPSTEPAATTNVVIDGPGEYVNRDGALVVITGKADEDSLADYPDHIWVDHCGEVYKPDGRWLDVKGDNHLDVVRKVVLPLTPETKPSNPKDVIGSTKPPLSCVPTGPLYEVGAAMLDGSAKYGRHNWRVVGVRSSVYYDAALRHLMKWWEGEDLDQDSGCHHLAHAVACCLIVRDAASLGQLTDDRPVPGGDPTAGVKDLIEQIKDRYPEPVKPYLASDK